MTTLRIPVDDAGLHLAAVLEGDPAAPAVVLLHALGETAASWSDLVPRLLPDRRTVALDLRGHGASDHAAVYSTAVMTDDVVAAVDALELPEFALVGHSLGGVVALQVAERLGARVNRLVVEDVVPPYPREARPVPERPDVDLPFDWGLLAPMYAEMNDPDLRAWPGLRRITAPTLVVAGGPSSHVPQARIEQMTDLLPDARRVTIDAGHEVHATEPEQFAAAVVGFLLG